MKFDIGKMSRKTADAFQFWITGTLHGNLDDFPSANQSIYHNPDLRVPRVLQGTPRLC